MKKRNILFLLLALAIILIITNQFTVKSMVLGVCGSVIYFLIGGYLTGRYLLKEKQLMISVPLGVFTLLALMGLVGWVFIIFRGLGVSEVAVILIAAFIFLVLLAIRGS
jgi:hypothetical protein